MQIHNYIYLAVGVILLIVGLEVLISKKIKLGFEGMTKGDPKPVYRFWGILYICIGVAYALVGVFFTSFVMIVTAVFIPMLIYGVRKFNYKPDTKAADTNKY